MDVPTSVYAECPSCGQETLHEVLRGRLGGKTSVVLESTLRCRTCHGVHSATLREERPVSIPVVISWMGESRRDSAVFGPQESVVVGEELMVGDIPLKITAIECGGQRVKEARAGAISTLWARQFDRVRVRFSISRAGRTYSEDVFALPDEEFTVGEMLEVGRSEVVIHNIRLKERTIHQGVALAKDIVRVYASIIRRSG